MKEKKMTVPKVSGARGVCLLCVTLLFLPTAEADDRPEVTIGGLLGLSGNAAFSANTVLGSVMCAMSEINSNDSLPVRYRLIYRDTESDKLTAFAGALQLSGVSLENTVLYSNGSAQARDSSEGSGFMQAFGAESQSSLAHVPSVNLDVPIIFGSSWSSITQHVNGVFSTFAQLQMGSSTTSADLADRDTYPSFHRLCPSDTLQAQAVVQLFVYMNWTRIGILHTQDSYGASLAFSILAEANRFNMTASGFSFTAGDYNSAEVSTKALQDSGEYVIVLIMFDQDIEIVKKALKKNTMWGFPYYYIGVDAWFGIPGIKQTNSNVSEFKGYLGTFPYFRSDSEASQRLDTLYRDFYSPDNYAAVGGYDEPELWGDYAYDTMHLINRVVVRFIRDYGVQELNASFRLNNQSSQFYNDPAQLFRVFSNYLTDPAMQFEGATGDVSLLPNGERRGGAFAFGNINEEDSMTILGTIVSIDEESYTIEWDDSFDELFELPQDWIDRGLTSVSSEPRTNEQEVFIYDGPFATIITLSTLGLFLAGSFFGLLQYFRDKTIIRASSRRLNQICCAGAMLYFATAILFGIDEKRETRKFLNRACNIRLTMMVLSVNLFFGPLILKTYRIYKIFVFVQRTLKEVDLNDYKLISWIASVCVFDLCLCIVCLGFLCPLKRDLVIGEEDSDINDSFQINQPYWYTCEVDGGRWRNGLYTALIIWFVLSKGAAMVYGVYLGFNVWSIERKSYNEAINLLSSLFLSSFTVVVSIVLDGFLSGNSNRKRKGVASLRYLLMFVPTTIACIISLCAIIGPKLHYILTKEDKPGATAYIESTVLAVVQSVISERQKLYEAEIASRTLPNQTVTHVPLQSTVEPSPQLRPYSPDQSGDQNDASHPDGSSKDATSKSDGSSDKPDYRKPVASSSPRMSPRFTVGSWLNKGIGMHSERSVFRVSGASTVVDKHSVSPRGRSEHMPFSRVKSNTMIHNRRLRLDTGDATTLKLPTAADLSRIAHGQASLETVVHDCLAADDGTMVGRSHSMRGEAMPKQDPKQYFTRSMSAPRVSDADLLERTGSGAGKTIAAMATALPIGSSGVRSTGAVRLVASSSDPIHTPTSVTATPTVNLTPASTMAGSEDATPVSSAAEQSEADEAVAEP